LRSAGQPIDPDSEGMIDEMKSASNVTKLVTTQLTVLRTQTGDSSEAITDIKRETAQRAVEMEASTADMAKGDERRDSEEVDMAVMSPGAEVQEDGEKELSTLRIA
jgi:hypothetical protein